MRSTALATLDVLTGATGPRIAPFTGDRDRALASLARLDDLRADLVLPGRGQRWTHGLDQALRIIREAEDGPTRGASLAEMRNVR